MLQIVGKVSGFDGGFAGFAVTEKISGNSVLQRASGGYHFSDFRADQFPFEVVSAISIAVILQNLGSLW